MLLSLTSGNYSAEMEFEDETVPQLVQTESEEAPLLIDLGDPVLASAKVPITVVTGTPHAQRSGSEASSMLCL